MTSADPPDGDASMRARAWHHAAHAAVCDVIERWAHGTIVRATRLPDYFDYNVVRVEEDPGMDVDALETLADEALAGIAHRRLDFELVGAAEPLRAAFERRGWLAMRRLWMRHEGTLPGGGPRVQELRVQERPYDAVNELRIAWQGEDFPGQDASGYHAQSREVALRRDARVLAMGADERPVAFAQLECHGAAAEITQVYVHPDHRGGGLGAAITRAAIGAAGGVDDLWICADDEDRPKELYVRLGFRPVWTTMEFLRLPQGKGRSA